MLSMFCTLDIQFDGAWLYMPPSTALHIIHTQHEWPRLPEGAGNDDVEAMVWEQMRTVFDPEIPINLVDRATWVGPGCLQGAPNAACAPKLVGLS